MPHCRGVDAIAYPASDGVEFLLVGESAFGRNIGA